MIRTLFMGGALTRIAVESLLALPAACAAAATTPPPALARRGYSPAAALMKRSRARATEKMAKRYYARMK